MKNSSTGMPPSDRAPARDDLPPEPGAEGTGGTRASVDGETAPRLPHERDESADTAPGTDDERIEKAAEDVAAGRQGTDRGEVTDSLYARTLRGDRGDPDEGRR